MALRRYLPAVLALPFNAVVTIPAVLLWLTPWQPGFGGGTAAVLAASLAGAALAVIGIALMVTTVRLFARVGEGTLAPWDPTARLVVEGPYRYVRNPMISGVCSVILGEALVFGSVPVLAWFGGFWLVNALYMPLAEEPGLAARFGDAYREYARNVPRWIPRRTPWRP